MHVVYIDDEDAEMHSFTAAFLLAKEDAVVTSFKPSFSIEETYNRIMSEASVDVVVTDYELSDCCDVSFDGADLVKYVTERQPFMPCFILTAFEDNAVKSDSVDVYHVYSKSILNDPSEGRLEHSVSFVDRVEEQTEKSKRRLARVEEEYHELLLRRVDAKWVSEDEDKLLEYDDLLERHYGAVKMSTHLKTKDYSGRVVDLITVTKELLREIRNDGKNT